MPPRRPPTLVPAGAADRSDSTALASDSLLRRADLSPGATLSTSTSSGCFECTPLTTGATRRSSTRFPIRLRTNGPRWVSRAPKKPGIRESICARKAPGNPMAVITSAAIGEPGMPNRLVLGSGCAEPSARYSHAPAGFGGTRSSPSPSSRTSAATVSPRVAKLSAPASSSTPAMVWLRTLPPTLADASSSSTDSPPMTRSRAAVSPAIPAPTTTTSTTAPRGSAMGVDELHDPGQHPRVGLRRNTMTEVHDVRRCRLAALDHVDHVALQHLPGSGEHGRVDVPLQGNPVTKAVAGFIERSPVVDSHDIRPHLVHGVQELSRSDAEMHDGHAEVAHVAERLGREAGNPLPVVRHTQRANPGIEQLGGTGAGKHLGLQELAGDIRRPTEQRIPGGRIRVHQCPSTQMVLRWTALDQVGSQGEWGSSETDE